MKFCAYCGKENEDIAARCCECDTDEFTTTPLVAQAPSSRTRNRRLRIFCIGCGLAALGLHTYDLIFVRFSAKETAHAVLWLAVVCSMFLSKQRDTFPKNIHGKNDNAA